MLSFIQVEIHYLKLNAPTITIGPNTIPEVELKNTGLVIKYGAEPEYTLGNTSSIKSVLRHATPNGKDYSSSEWCVINFGKKTRCIFCKERLWPTDAHSMTCNADVKQDFEFVYTSCGDKYET
ncbi:hypothetical protein NW768_006546 [Fusarium equiseti]|uniref:Uncharacterized protein n=1 Tax=Fusarium equiseti TaxID=61235 RepID=A0ABQ8RBT3_FUSEQ|nr:hypothetical protein NW768_006546 [Fusarium equiseti]